MNHGQFQQSAVIFDLEIVPSQTSPHQGSRRGRRYGYPSLWGRMSLSLLIAQHIFVSAKMAPNNIEEEEMKYCLLHPLYHYQTIRQYRHSSTYKGCKATK
ncbi:hypothetical protein LOAG_05165 [Loa loa]|uniref:Uncharacterized protein n=1 Tax=Loa loa TaxID=7209 RepID=A0A1S0U129_LOALO|nr:hypothetical protein LOAG_05165 [Loa loa]EFO23327.1 hypothetical protein LOAG_05165 [Loa loa]